MDDEDLENGQTALASQACISCRKNKRKCDKQLPSCGLCERLRRSCIYTIAAEVQSASPSSEEFAALKQQVLDLQKAFSSRSPTSEGSLHNSDNVSSNGNGATSPALTSFPSLIFLDSDAFHYGNHAIRLPSIQVPSNALASLGSSIELRQMIETYFSFVHPYFPIISKIRLYQHLSDPLHDPDASLALLFLAMKLVCSEIVETASPLTPLYQDVKAFYHYVEAQNGLGVAMIQALLLIALYEMGHAIYPAAYLTIGNAARVGYATGLHDTKAPQMLPRPTTWTEQEERRRLWWGIIVLDRLINIGHRGKAFATTDPSVETHLPTDDAAWDRGQMLVAAPLSLSASPTAVASAFARTCQAAHLLGKALRHIDDKSIPLEYRFDDALQLHRTMRAFADAAGSDNGDEKSAFRSGALFTSQSIIYSGLLVLYDSYSCTGANPTSNESQLRMQKESIDGLRNITDRVVHLARQLQQVINNGGLNTVNPMTIDCIYQGAANCAWYYRETSDKTCGGRLIELKNLLSLLDRRWKVAGEYLRIVESWQTSTTIMQSVRLEDGLLDLPDRMER